MQDDASNRPPAGSPPPGTSPPAAIETEADFLPRRASSCASARRRRRSSPPPRPTFNSRRKDARAAGIQQARMARSREQGQKRCEELAGHKYADLRNLDHFTDTTLANETPLPAI